MTSTNMSSQDTVGIPSFLTGMLRSSLQGQTRIDTLAQLIFAEEVIDDMESRKEASLTCQLLRARAEAFVRANPELLNAPWLRNGGAVYDIIERVRNEVLDATLRLSHSIGQLAG